MNANDAGFGNVNYPVIAVAETAGVEKIQPVIIIIFRRMRMPEKRNIRLFASRNIFQFL